MPQIKAKAVRALAVTGDKRAAALPEVPTAQESGGADRFRRLVLECTGSARPRHRAT